MSKRAFRTAGCASTPSKGSIFAFPSAGFSSSWARAGAENRRFSICSAGWKSRLRAKSSMREGRFLRCLPASLMSTAPARRALSFRRKTSSPRSPSRKTSLFRTLPPSAKDRGRAGHRRAFGEKGQRTFGRAAAARRHRAGACARVPRAACGRAHGQFISRTKRNVKLVFV